MFDKNNLLLYLCADRTRSPYRPLIETIDEAISGGVTTVQLREKDISGREFYETATALLALTKRRGVPLIINDRLDVALACGADGVHLGQSDLPAAEARRIAGRSLIIGVSARTVALALQAEQDGADYLGTGPAFPTKTKNIAPIGLERLQEIVQAVKIPVIGIGGIKASNAQTVLKTGVAGVAVVDAILTRQDTKAAALSIREALSCSQV